MLHAIKYFSKRQDVTPTSFDLGLFVTNPIEILTTCPCLMSKYRFLMVRKIPINLFFDYAKELSKTYIVI